MGVEELKKWLKNKDVRIWKRMLVLLCETGEPMTAPEIGIALRVERSNAHKTLKKFQIDSNVKSERIGKNRVAWSITSNGIKMVRTMQKKGLVPKRD